MENTPNRLLKKIRDFGDWQYQMTKESDDFGYAGHFDIYSARSLLLGSLIIDAIHTKSLIKKALLIKLLEMLTKRD